MEKMATVRIAALSIGLLVGGGRLSSNAQVIPDADRVCWPGAGLWTGAPSSADRVFQVNLMPGATVDDKVANALDSAKAWTDAHPSSWALIYFPRGTHELHNEIVLDYSYRNIVFQGNGAYGPYSTTLKFAFGGTNQNCFKVEGYQQESSKRYLASDLEKGSPYVVCKTEIGYSTPSWIR